MEHAVLIPIPSLPNASRMFLLQKCANCHHEHNTNFLSFIRRIKQQPLPSQMSELRKQQREVETARNVIQITLTIKLQIAREFQLQGRMFKLCYLDHQYQEPVTIIMKLHHTGTVMPVPILPSTMRSPMHPKWSITSVTTYLSNTLESLLLSPRLNLRAYNPHYSKKVPNLTDCKIYRLIILCGD